jgi:plasmid stability protein
MPTPRKLDPEGNGNGIVICNFRTTSDNLARIKRAATRHGWSMSDYIRSVLQEALEEDEQTTA